MYSMIKIQKRVIGWGNSAGVYVPRKYIGREVIIKILEKPKLSTKFIYGITISMECYGFSLIKSDNFKPELYNEKELKGYNIWDYDEEEIKITSPEDIILKLLTKKQDFRLIKGIPIILYKYKKTIDFNYLIEKCKESDKIEFLGYLLNITNNILKKYKLRGDLRRKISSIIRNMNKIKEIRSKTKKIQFLNKELERIYKKTKKPEKIESTKRDKLMKKYNIAYFPKQKEFEEVFEIYYED